MRYENRVVEGSFISRPNRFIANVMVDGRTEVCHVKNTGRCSELLVPGCRLFLEESSNKERRTKYDVIAVEKKREGLPPLLINMDSQAPNKAVREWLEKGELFGPSAVIRQEEVYGTSRFDFAIEERSGRKSFLEVKGCTLEEDGIVMFPDAPTLRGLKHVRELIKAREEGFGAYILILVQMKGASFFKPNWKTQPEFGYALREARDKGVIILAYDSVVTPSSITLSESVRVDLF